MILQLILFVIVVVAYHETAHAVAAIRYQCLEAVVLFRATTGWKQLFLWGAGVEIDDDRITDRQQLHITLAPLVFVPVAMLSFGGWHLSGNEGVGVAMYIFGAAGVLTLFSDVPQYLLDWQDVEGVEYNLITFDYDG